jgi:hypothetical protein
MALTLRQLAGIDEYCVLRTNVTRDELEDAFKLAKPLKDDNDITAADVLKQNIKKQLLEDIPAPDKDVKKHLLDLMEREEEYSAETAALISNYARLVGWLKGYRPKGDWM